MKNWIQICVCANKKYEEDISAILLEKFPAGLFVNEQNDIYSICAYCPDNKEFELSFDKLEKNIAALKNENNAPDISITTSKLCSDVWENVLRGTFKPLHCGKFYITPDWEKFIPDDKITLTLNPGLAFGSGEHETTFLCLEAISEIDVKNKDFLDVGCGAGILSIGAKKLDAENVVAIDIDPIAVEVSKENALKNNVSIEVLEADSPKMIGGKFDIVVANIFANVLIQMSSDLNNCCKNNGILMLSGIELSQSEEVERCFLKKDLILTEKKTKNEWVLLIFKKR